MEFLSISHLLVRAYLWIESMKGKNPSDDIVRLKKRFNRYHYTILIKVDGAKIKDGRALYRVPFPVIYNDVTSGKLRKLFLTNIPGYQENDTDDMRWENFGRRCELVKERILENVANRLLYHCGVIGTIMSAVITFLLTVIVGCLLEFVSRPYDDCIALVSCVLISAFASFNFIHGIIMMAKYHPVEPDWDDEFVLGNALITII